RLSPPSLVRGKTTRLTLVGSELRGATGLWTSLAGKDIEARPVESSGDDRACFDVRVDRDAPLGLYGLRLATRSGLSNVKVFQIDDRPAVTGRESSPRTAEPQRLGWPVAVMGRADAADVDRYSIDVEAGRRLTFEVVASRLGQDFDPVVTIKDARGRHIVEQ